MASKQEKLKKAIKLLNETNFFEEAEQGISAGWYKLDAAGIEQRRAELLGLMRIKESLLRIDEVDYDGSVTKPD